jgi:pyruvate,water dikinase
LAYIDRLILHVYTDKTREKELAAYVVPLHQFGMADIAHVGGKNASLGEMIKNLSALGVRVPGGFATTTQAYRDFLQQTGNERLPLGERIQSALIDLDVENIDALERAGHQIRGWIKAQAFPARLQQEIEAAWQAMQAEHPAELNVAVRSSATAEDLPGASFAGQQETFLNICGLDQLLTSVRNVYASLYNDRAIAYRVHQGFKHADVALSVGVQHMVRSDLACSGVMFTLDTESGFRDMVLITASYGLGESVVQGAVNPDEFYAYKPALRAGKRALLRKNLGDKAVKMIYADWSMSIRPIRCGSH